MSRIIETDAGDVDEARRRARREDVLAAATALFAEQGYEAAGTQDLADRLGVGKGTLYRCFPSKRDLFLAAVDRVMVRMAEHIEAATRECADPWDRVAGTTRAYLDFFKAHPDFVVLLIQERALFKDRPLPTYFEHRRRLQVRWREFYRSLIAAGQVREVPVERIVDVWSNLLYGTMIANALTGSRADPAAQSKDILDILCRGIFSDEQRARASAAAP